MFADPEVEALTVASAAQVAKTMLVFLCLGWTLDQQPGPAMMVLPNIDLARKISKERLKPFLEDCDCLAKLIPKNKDLFSNLEMTLKRSTLLLAGSNSPANIASFPIKYLFLDEVDKFAEASEKEASAVALAIKRITSYSGAKLVRTSTPTVETGEIWKALATSDWRKFFVPCPHCKHMQVLEWKNIVWPDDCKNADGGYDLERVEAETRYRCSHADCGRLIENSRKRWMIARGEWRATRKGQKGHIGYHISALYALWEKTTWGKLAVEWLNAQPYPDLLQDFINSRLAECWTIPGKAASEQEILSHRGGYESGTCPEEPVEVILTVDRQANHFYYVVRAWGRAETSWKLEHGICATYADVLQVTRHIYSGPHGPFGITRRFMDSGDETTEVYRWCAENNFLPWKGQERSKARVLYKLATLDDGTILFEFQSNQFKDFLQSKFKIAVKDEHTQRPAPGAWMISDDTGFDYASHLTAEVKRMQKDRWGAPVFDWFQIRDDNHWLDCEVAQLAAAMFLAVRHRVPEGSPAMAPSPKPHGGSGRSARDDAAAEGNDGFVRNFKVTRKLSIRKGGRH